VASYVREHSSGHWECLPQRGPGHRRRARVSRHRRGFLQIHHPQLRVGHPTDVRATKSQPRSVRMPWRPVPSKSATPTHTPRCYPPDQVAELAVPLDRLALYHPRRRGGHKDPDRPHELDILKLHPHAYRMPRRRRKCQVPRPIQ
jgi:hypothetical protein